MKLTENLKQIIRSLSALQIARLRKEVRRLKKCVLIDMTDNLVEIENVPGL